MAKKGQKKDLSFFLGHFTWNCPVVGGGGVVVGLVVAVLSTFYVLILKNLNLSRFGAPFHSTAVHL